MLKLRPIFQHRERLAHIRRTVVIATVREAAPAKHVWTHPACCAAAVGALENWVSAWPHSGTCNAAENPSSAGFAEVVFYRPCSSVHDLSPLSSLRSNPAFKPMALLARLNNANVTLAPQVPFRDVRHQISNRRVRIKLDHFGFPHSVAFAALRPNLNHCGVMFHLGFLVVAT